MKAEKKASIQDSKAHEEYFKAKVIRAARLARAAAYSGPWHFVDTWEKFGRDFRKATSPHVSASFKGRIMLGGDVTHFYNRAGLLLKALKPRRRG